MSHLDFQITRQALQTHMDKYSPTQQLFGSMYLTQIDNRRHLTPNLLAENFKHFYYPEPSAMPAWRLVCLIYILPQLFYSMAAHYHFGVFHPDFVTSALFLQSGTGRR